MRLLHTTKIELADFADDCIPRYAILSHRWQDEEVLFPDMQSGAAVHKKGYAKLRQCCDQAAMDDLDYVWVDTCCVDKTSSAELSEAINSMYLWYRNAAVCYAFLFDVHSTTVTRRTSFWNSVWFTRAWTLQELIAPANVKFYNSTWHQLGTKENLVTFISEATGIDLSVLQGADPETVSIAKRMSWASKRMATRHEDVSYSLLGLFGANMPLLYGEGDRAFVRLQAEIMKKSDDQSIFAWTDTSHHEYRGLLATSPAVFQHCSNIVTSKVRLNRKPYFLNNMGLSIEVFLIPWAMETYLVALDCEVQSRSQSRTNNRVGILLKLLRQKDHYARVTLSTAAGTISGKAHDNSSNCYDTVPFTSALLLKCEYQKVYVRQKMLETRPPLEFLYGFRLRKMPPFSSLDNECWELQRVKTCVEWSKEDRENGIYKLQIPVGKRGTAGVLWFASNSDTVQRKTLKLGFDSMFNPVCELCPYAEYTWGDMALEEIDAQGTEDKEWVFVGDRIGGLDEVNSEHRLTITKELFGGQWMWLVDIYHNSDPEWSPGDTALYTSTCDRCGIKINGEFFSCLKCADFACCTKCYVAATIVHASHPFRKVDLRFNTPKIDIS